MSDEDEFRFYPEDFDDSGELIDDDDLDPAALVIVGGLGAGIGLFLLDPFVDPVRAAGTQLELRTLSSFVFAVGLLAGSGVYARQGKRSLAMVHGLGGSGWVLLALGAVLAEDTLLVAGALALVAGVATLLVLLWRASL